MKPWIFLATSLIVLVVLLLGCKTTRAGYNEPVHKVLQSDGAFELRDYSPMIVATAPMEGGDGMNGGFGKLFRFITGSNAKEQKIAMTTPVLVETAPTNSRMSFVMPSEMTVGEVPQPNDSSVSVREMPGGEYAVYRFSGSRSESLQREAATKLMGWITARGWTAVGEPQFAYYDPPWTPAFLRRNEAVVRVQRPAPPATK